MPSNSTRGIRPVRRAHHLEKLIAVQCVGVRCLGGESRKHQDKKQGPSHLFLHRRDGEIVAVLVLQQLIDAQLANLTVSVSSRRWPHLAPRRRPAQAPAATPVLAAGRAMAEMR
jgi:hypothetical protein